MGLAIVIISKIESNALVKAKTGENSSTGFFRFKRRFTLIRHFVPVNQNHQPKIVNDLKYPPSVRLPTPNFLQFSLRQPIQAP